MRRTATLAPPSLGLPARSPRGCCVGADMGACGGEVGRGTSLSNRPAGAGIGVHGVAHSASEAASPQSSGKGWAIVRDGSLPKVLRASLLSSLLQVERLFQLATESIAACCSMSEQQLGYMLDKLGQTLETRDSIFAELFTLQIITDHR